MCEIRAVPALALSKADAANGRQSLFPAEPGRNFRALFSTGLPSTTTGQLELATLSKLFAIVGLDCILLKPSTEGRTGQS